MALNSFAPAPSRCQVTGGLSVGAGIGTETLCIIVKIVSGYLTLSLQKTQLLAPSGPSTGL